jgi:antitoxin FitA
MESSRYHFRKVAEVAHVVIRNIDDEVMRRLKSRAARKGVSLQRELRTILTEAVHADRARFGEQAAGFRRKLAGRRPSDSTALIRTERDR